MASLRIVTARTRCIASLLLMLIAVNASAQEIGQAFAVVRDNELFIINLVDVYNKVNIPPHVGFTSMAWSPDGGQLAFIMQDTNYNPVLMVAPGGGGDAVALPNAGLIEIGFPVTWTPDGSILYVQSTFDPNVPPGDEYRVRINTLTPSPDAQPVTLGTIPFGVGCGGGSSLPSDWQYWTESGGFGGTYLTLAWTEWGIVHSVNCGGGGVGLLDPRTGISRYVTPVQAENGFIQSDITRLALSPDGVTVAGIQLTYVEPNPIEQIVLIDLSTAEMRALPAAPQPDQLTFAPDGTLYFSTRQPSEADLLAGLSSEGRAALEQGGLQGFAVPAYTVGIFRYDLMTDTVTPIYSGDASQIGKMRALADGSLWFSQIPNLNGWIDALASGQIDPVNDITGEQQRATVPVSLYRIDPAQPQAELKGQGLGQFTPRVS